jgi:hypothetical protein
MLYAKATGVTRWNGGTTVLKAGQSIEEDHPLALERPDLFRAGDDTPDIKKAPEGRTRHRGESPEVVETATRAPGERRTLPRKAQGGSNGG